MRAHPARATRAARGAAADGGRAGGRAGGQAFDEAITDLDSLSEESYKDATLIMQARPLARASHAGAPYRGVPCRALSSPSHCAAAPCDGDRATVPRSRTPTHRAAVLRDHEAGPPS